MYRILKRFLDLVLAVLALLIVLPFFIIIIVILKFTGEGEVFYLQKRIGYKNQYFFIFKFATMLKNSLNLGTGSITLKDDFRVTKFGKILRKTKLNELPQILNVIKGDLSIVGPRPLVDSTFNAYEKETQNNIYNVKPGITGIGSIIFRDEETLISEANDPHLFYKQNIAPLKGKVELWYQKNASLYIDLKIIFLTAWVIFFTKSKLYNKWFKKLPK